MSKFDTEYYVMSLDGANNHPLLSWGDTSNALFREELPIRNEELNFRLKIRWPDKERGRFVAKTIRL